MILYKYTARDMDSKKIKGKMEANNRKELATFLRAKEQFLIDCKDTSKIDGNLYKLKLRELSEFSRQMGTMIGSGVSLIRSISILSQRESNPKIKKILADIYRKLQQGNTLSQAMEEQGNAFPELMIQMYRSGETSGQMEKVALTMANQYDKDNHIQSKIKNAMVYPAILSSITVLVIIAVFTWIIPSFSSVFTGMELPFITKVMSHLSAFILHEWYWIIIVLLCLIAIVGIALKNELVRYKVDQVKLRMPILGKLLCTIYTARFARTMCSLYTSGVSIINGLTIVKTTIGNTYIQSQFSKVIQLLRSGTTLSQSIQKVDGFDLKLSSSIFIGEESGKLDEMLTSLADDFDYDAEMATQKMVTLLEPIMIVVLAIIVCLVMLSVLLPIYQMYQNPTGL